MPVFKKYTVQSKGIWEKVRKLLTLVHNRSTGNPIVPYYRVPAPGSRPEAKHYTDPFTVPAGDIAENPYYARDHRRNYPQTAIFDQSTVAGLLSYGSAANPRIADGEAGTKALAEVTSGQLSLNKALSVAPKNVVQGQILSAKGLPPVPPSLTTKTWTILPESETGMYTDKYPVRMFS